MLKRFANVLVFLSLLWTGFLGYVEGTQGLATTLFFGLPTIILALCFLYIVRGSNA